MRRFLAILALVAPLAGVAFATDEFGSEPMQTFEIRVAADEIETCRDTLRELKGDPIVTDDGVQLPAFMRSDDLPETVCVIDA